MLQGVIVLVPIVLSLHLVCIQISYDMAYFFFLICSLALCNRGTLYICLILLCVNQNAFCIAVLFSRCSKSLWLYACPKNSIERKRNRTILSNFTLYGFEWVSSSQQYDGDNTLWLQMNNITIKLYEIYKFEGVGERCRVTHKA